MSVRPLSAAVLAAAVPLLAAPPDALAEHPCEICDDLDDAEEWCEDLFGDGTPLCEAIGEVEEACPQADDGGDGEEGDDGEGDESPPPGSECPDLCEETAPLVESCEAELGSDHGLCEELAEIHAGACGADDEDDDDDEADDDDDADDDVAGGDDDSAADDEDEDAEVPGGCQTAPAPVATPGLALFSALAVGLRRRVG